MSIQRIGGAPVYVIRANPGRETNARGESYGSLVSSERWRIWEEIKDSELRQMQLEGAAQGAIESARRQKLQDLSRLIRDTKRIKYNLERDFIKASDVPRAKSEAQNTDRTVTYSPYTEQKLDYLGRLKTVEQGGRTTTTTYAKNRGTDGEESESESDRRARLGAQKDEALKDIDEEIIELEKQYGESIDYSTGSPLSSGDLIARTRDSFERNVGVGGLGLAPRRGKVLPTFNEERALQNIESARAQSRENLESEAQKRMGDKPVTSEQLERVRALADRQFLSAFDDVGPVSARDFLDREPPPYSPLLPMRDTRVPTGRVRDNFGMERAREPLSRESEIIGDMSATRDPQYWEGELEDVRSVNNISRKPSTPPSIDVLKRRLELEALGMEPEQIEGSLPSFLSQVQIERDIDLESKKRASDRGFSTPLTTISEGVGPQTVSGEPGNVNDRNVVRRLLNDRERERALEDKKRALEFEALQFGGGPLAPSAPDMPPGEEMFPIPEPKQKREREKGLSPRGRGDDIKLDETLPEAPISSRLTLPQKRDQYTIRTIREGLDVAQKPKKLERLVSTGSPVVKIVDKIWDINSGKSGAFKMAWDEVSRYYANSPKDRELAHKYLVAKDALSDSVVKPT
jgi:hypothetical protein